MIRSVDTLSKIFLPDNFPMGPRGQLTLPLLGTTLLAKCDRFFQIDETRLKRHNAEGPISWTSMFPAK